MTTIKEIAQKAGVSIGTVDRVIHNRGIVNAQTKERVLSVMEELNYKPNSVAQGLAARKKKLKLCYLMMNPMFVHFMKKVKEAAEEKAEALKQYGVQVTFYVLSIEDVYENEENSELLDSLKEQDGLAVFGVETTAIQLFLDEADKWGIPIVFYNTMLEDRNFLAYVGCDYIKAGRMAAGLSALAGGEDAKICIYTEAITQIASHHERLRGLREEIKERYPLMKVLDIREISRNQIDNYLSAQEMLRKFPDVNIVYVVNQGDYGICEAIYRADEKHQIKIITNDLVDEQVAMIEQGMISATICQEPEKQGAMPLEILFRYLAFGEQPENRMCYTDLSIQIAQNI